MTHFMIGIVIPQRIFENQSVKGYISSVLDKFSENKEIEPYIDIEAEELESKFEEFKRDLRKTINSEDEEVKSYLKDYLNDNNEVKDISVEEWAENYFGQEVDDEGNLLTTYNPQTIYDWYRVGGRYDGVITDNIHRSEDGGNFDSKYETVENNSIKISELIRQVEKKETKIKIFNEAKEKIIEKMDYPLSGLEMYSEVKDTIDKVLNKTTEEIEQELKNKINHNLDTVVNTMEIWSDNQMEALNNKDYEQAKLDEIAREQRGKIEEKVKDWLEDMDFNNQYLLGKIIDTDGEVHNWKDYGWFGTSEEQIDREDYLEEYLELLRNNQNSYLVTLDCHI